MIFSNLITKIHHINFRKRFRVDKYYLIYDKIKFNSVRFQMKRLFKKDSLNLHSNNRKMSNIRITKQFSFETGHALYGYDGKCKNVHGHSYKLSVTVIGTPISDAQNVKFGMVIDFTDLKKIVKEEIVDQFDHATVFNKNTPHVELAHELESRGHHVILVDYQPTSENMVIDFSNRIKNRLPKNISLFSLKLQETETSFAEWFASDNL